DLLQLLAYEHHINEKFVKPFGEAAPVADGNFFSPVANGPRLRYPRRYPSHERFPAIVKSVMEASLEKSGIAYMGSKTPGRWVGTDFDLIKSIFGPPKLVFVVRNPRDTVNSIVNRRNLTRAGRDNWNFETVEQAIDVYREGTAQLMSCALEMPNDTFVVGYEDLLANPSETLALLGEFLGLDLRDRSGLIQQTNRGKDVLTDDEERLVEAAFGSALQTWDQKRLTGEGARVAAMLDDCVMTPEDGFAYRFDSPAALRAVFGAGWAEATSDGVWSDGPVADMFLSLPAGRYVFTLELAGFLPKPDSPQVECLIQIDDTPAFTHTFAYMSAARFEFKDVNLTHDGMQRLSFRFAGLKQARERGGADGDARRLGVCARGLKVQRLPEAGSS
ncbi:MAG TPA: sulfotransferase, partial [Candidatus Acidoferrales bacterium]|nr:sulfotransferase [Candidatus Acidoferrales bacterium]